MTLELTLVEDVPGAFATLFGAALAATPAGAALRYGCSGGTTGRAVMDRLAATPLEWGKVSLFFADERFVPPGSSEANEAQVRAALGSHVDELAGFSPMRCSEGPVAYEELLRAAGELHVLQLGVGPDGHTASLFPGSSGLEAPPGRLVVENEDPSGRNPHRRSTLTFEAISSSHLVVVTLTGADKAAVLARLAGGEDLPAGRLPADHTIWLVDPPAAAGLPARPAGVEELEELGRRAR